MLLFFYNILLHNSIKTKATMNSKSTLFLFCLLPSMSVYAEPEGDIHRGEDMVITTGHKLFPNTTIATPSFGVSKEDIAKTNLISAEDALKMAPSVQVRRRFYADTNGVTGIRGSNPFQTNHFNAYVDGIPIHNPVQTRFNGAPKWNIIAPNAIETSTVFYGPYSAEHRSAFGGTFDLKTRLPEEFEMSMEVTGIIQDSNLMGQEEVLTGHKEFLSAGNRFGNWLVYGFYNHLENEGQAQSFSTKSSTPDNTTGSFRQDDIKNNKRYITGDRGLNENLTDLYELKIGYDFNPDLRGLFTIAFEDTERVSKGRTYLTDSTGNADWVSAGSSGKMKDSDNERKTLMYGFNLSGKLTDNWDIDTTASFFDAFKDQTITSNFSHNDPRYATDKEGDVKDIDVWWADYSIKLATQNLFGRDDLGFMAGYQFNHSFLDIDKHEINENGTHTNRLLDADGGSTEIHSAFMQADWDFIENWNIMAGFRYDYWSASRGHINNSDLPDRDASRISPKASLAFTPTNELSLRYSFSKAYRFAVAEELFNSSKSVNVENISDPNLAPETGYFHDFNIRYELDQGYTSVSFFYNEIEDEIQSTSILLNDGNEKRQTQGIGKTETIGIEMVYQQDYIMDLPIGLSLNGTWLNKEIKENPKNPKFVDKEWTRVPKWRANATLTYHATSNWDNIVSLQYRSNEFNKADNSDTNPKAYGGVGEHVLVNIKSDYKMDVGNDMTAKFSVGIDNLLDEEYYEFHPYPQRTFFATIGLDI